MKSVSRFCERYKLHLWNQELSICSLFSTTLVTSAEIPKRFLPPKHIFEKRNFVKEIVRWANEVKLPVHYVTMSTESGNIKCPPFCLYCKRTSIVIWSFSGMMSAVIPGYVQRAPPSTDGLIATCLVASGVLNALICGISLSIFLGQLMHALFRNETTLENTSFQFCDNNNDQHAAGNISYDLGSVWDNFCSIFGYNPLLWLLPIPTTYGNGFFKEAILKKKIAK
ncbi:Palmitoyltransferase [Dirofilaria immitis]|nr:Palmitoyltransferase [Dirofilaria immitis]